MEHHKKEHVPAYFEPQQVAADGMTYYKYNETYFERDRKTQDWSRLDQIYSYELNEEIKEFLKVKK